MPSDTPLADADLLGRIPLSSRVVLDVGCGRGERLAALRAVAPTMQLLGLSGSTADAAAAATRLDEVGLINLDTDKLPFDIPGGIDCILYRDVLPQLRDPWGVIRRHAEALSPGGVMLLYVPNVEHWRFADRLLRGVWDYADEERGTLRWFTLETLRRGLLAAGLTPCDVHPVGVEAEEAETFAAALGPGLAALGIDPDGFARRAAPKGFLWRARKAPPQRLTIAGNMLAPVGGVSHVRVVHPLHAMATDPQVTTQLTDRVTSAPQGDDPRIFVLHRPALSGAQGRAMLRALMDSGWLVVTEFDDHPDFFVAMQETGGLSFRGVHAVQTSTPALAEVLRKHNPEVAVFPNAIVSLPPVRNFTDPNRLTLFFGALNREPDWRNLLPVVNAVAAKAGDRLCFRVVHDQAFFDALATPHKAFTPTCDYDTYMALLGQCEISFMPLADNAFNRAKSDLKFIEAGACRVAPLASTVVYGDSVEDGRTGLLFRDAAELQSRLLRLVAMPELARSLADAARHYVAGQRMLAYQVAPRLAWYRSLWARRDGLTAALQARMAETLQPAA